MGLMAQLLKVRAAKSATYGEAAGKSAVAQGEGFADQVLDPVEIYQAPGVYALPGDGTRGVYLPIGGSDRYGVVVAMHNYQINIDVGGQGGAAIYSTTADGKTVKSKIVLLPDGTIEINGNGKRLVTWQELQDALTSLANTLKSHTHPVATTGTAAAQTGTASASAGLASLAVDISGAKTTTLKTGG